MNKKTRSIVLLAVFGVLAVVVIGYNLMSGGGEPATPPETIQAAASLAEDMSKKQPEVPPTVYTPENKPGKLNR